MFTILGIKAKLLGSAVLSISASFQTLQPQVKQI